MLIKRHGKKSYFSKTNSKQIRKHKISTNMSLASARKKVKGSSNRPSKNNYSKYPDEKQLANEQNKADIEKHVFIYLVRGGVTDTHDLRAWYYISVNEDNQKAFLSSIETSETVDIAEYGKILCSGWGEDPPLHVVRNIRMEIQLPFFKEGLRKLGLNCTAINRTDLLGR